jgi:hypothetical protein
MGRAQEIMSTKGDMIVQAFVFFDTFRSVKKQIKIFIIAAIKAIGFHAVKSKKNSPIFKQTAEKAVV